MELFDVGQPDVVFVIHIQCQQLQQSPFFLFQASLSDLSMPSNKLRRTGSRFLGVPNCRHSRVVIRPLVYLCLSSGYSVEYFRTQFIKRLGNAVIIGDVRKNCLKGDLR